MSIFDHLKIGIIIIEGREVCPKPPVEEGRFQAHLIAPNIFRKKGPPVAQLESARFEPAGCRCINHDIRGKDRKRVVKGKSVAGRVTLGGRRLHKKKKTNKQINKTTY